MPPERLKEEVIKVARKIMANGPSALRMAKTMLNFDSDQRYPMVTHAREILSHYLSTEESKEGFRAFLEKRDPVWKKQG